MEKSLGLSDQWEKTRLLRGKRKGDCNVLIVVGEVALSYRSNDDEEAISWKQYTKI